MTISVVVVTWNGLHHLRRFATAIEAQSSVHELVVVDNGSLDGTADWVRASLPHARLIALPSNLGFAGGNNVGLRATSGDLLVLLNNDTVPQPDFLAQITQQLRGADDIGSVAGVLTFAQRPSIVAAAGIVAGRDG